MTVTRSIGTISSDPDGKSGAEWTTDVSQSLAALWALNGGVLASVAGTNTITATIAVADGFAAYTDGLRVGFIAAATNTGASTINVSAVGVKSLVDPDGSPLVAGSIVLGRFTEAVFVSADDSFRLATSGGTTNVTVTGGTFLQRSTPARLAAAAGPATALTAIGSKSFQCQYSTSRVVVDGNISRVTGAGSADVDGVVVALYVDAVEVETFTDHCEPSTQANTVIYFEYSPGDISAHTYEIRVSSTISSTYPKGANVLWCSEVAPNA